MKKQKTTTITKSFYLFWKKNSKKKLGFVVDKKISKSERKKERERERRERRRLSRLVEWSGVVIS